jgi:hypothetical protein
MKNRQSHPISSLGLAGRWYLVNRPAVHVNCAAASAAMFRIGYRASQLRLTALRCFGAEPIREINVKAKPKLIKCFQDFTTAKGAHP